MKERRQIFDSVPLGSYEVIEGKGVQLSTITKNAGDTQALDGLLIKGYETKFGNTNENREQYDPHCFDKFIDKYFVKNKLNMPLNIQHNNDLDHLAGRVLVLEVNSVGFYFVCYIPKTYCRYDEVKALLQEGILQGLSKWGWATDYDWICTNQKTGEGYWLIKEMEIFEVSLVSTPANPIALEKMQEIKNSLQYVQNIENEKEKVQGTDDVFAKLFH